MIPTGISDISYFCIAFNNGKCRIDWPLSDDGTSDKDVCKKFW